MTSNGPGPTINKYHAKLSPFTTHVDHFSFIVGPLSIRLETTALCNDEDLGFV
jgi:hypothetical protein